MNAVYEMRHLVVKFGTQALIGLDGSLDQAIFAEVARQVAVLRREGVVVSIVSSGAIKAGREHLAAMGVDDSSLEKKEISAIGAPHLVGRWGEAFKPHSLAVAQILVTFSDLQRTPERHSVLSCILNFYRCDIIPVINANDVVSCEEIRSMERGGSENDKLARMIAFLINADAILFVTACGGIYTGDPQVDSPVHMYREVDFRASSADLGISSRMSPHGSGGMRAKYVEAVMCHEAGMCAAIAGVGDIISFARGGIAGTLMGDVTRFANIRF